MRNGEEKRPFKEDFALFRRALRILWKISPQYIVWQIVYGVVDAVTPFFGVYMSARIVNELLGARDGKTLFILAAITVFGGLFIQIFSRIVKGRQTVWMQNSWRNEDLFFLDVQNRMQYNHLENPDVALLRENIFAAKNANGSGLMKVQWSIRRLVNCCASIITSLVLSVTILTSVADGEFTGFLLFANSPWAVLSLGALVVAECFFLIRIGNSATEKNAKEWEALSKYNTHNGYYGSLYTSDTYIFGMKRLILPELERVMIRPRYIINSNRILAKSQVLSRIIRSTVELWLFVIVAAKAFVGAIGIGNYILYRMTILKLIDGICVIVSWIGYLRFNSKYLVQLYQYLDLPDEMYHGTLAVEKRDDIDYEIEFRNVSFRYPNTEVFALKNVSMKFHIGDKLAVVGENGSGKTTFIKLLCRLYDPTEGTILLNGIDITRYRYDEYLNLFSVVFQDYKLFSFSLAANVSCSHDPDPERVRDCLIRAGLGEKLNGLEKGIETALHRDFENDGIDLSGGEEQRLALARALYKDAPFVVLDEPTAALDPIGEAEVYENFNKLVDNKTSVFVSHRLSSCRFCDDILVFDHGAIVQRGPHDDLVSDRDGQYYALWNAQAKYYTS